MKLTVLREKTNGETRVAITPDSVKDFVELGVDVFVEKNAGVLSGNTDDDYKNAGAKIPSDIDKSLALSDVIVSVRSLPTTKISKMKEGAILVGMLASSGDALIKKYASNKISVFSMEFVPRISRAQNMDVLSSQSNLAGYRAVIDGVFEYGKVLPMMMTAAGTIRPAKILVLGAGVAGLQAIATAKRLGAVVSAFDVRASVKEQVESLGASFVEVQSSGDNDGEDKGGYAKEMSESYKKKQSELIHKTLKENDIIICTALIPGRPAPVLIAEKMVKSMKPGSVIVDLAVASGGNCPLSQLDKVVVKHGVKIVGYENMAGRVAGDASRLYARNLFNFISPMVNKKLKRIKIDFEDEIMQATLLTHEGKIVHPSFKKRKK